MILITGSAGFIGSHLVESLDNFKGVDLKTGDDVFDIRSLDEYEAVIHLAAMSSIPQSIKSPVKCSVQNIAATQHILSLKPRKLIFASSGSVVDPVSPYAMSKLVAEQLIKQSGVRHCILRLGNVYGERDDKSAIKHFLEDEIITVNGDGSQVRSFVYVKDVVEAFKVALNVEGTHYIGHETMTIKQVADIFGKPINYAPLPAGETHDYGIGWENSLTNWKPKVKLKEWVWK